MKIFEKYRKEAIIMLVVLGIPILFIIIINLFNHKDVNSIKSKNGSKLPQVNVSGSNADALNEYLESLYEEYTKDGKSKFDYKYEKYNDIISILVEIDRYDYDSNRYIKQYMSFNINKDGSYLTNEDISELFGYDILEIKEKIDKKMEEYYIQEINLGYVDNTCNYECYLKEKNINYIMDKVSLVIEDETLIVYLSVDTNSEYLDSLKSNPYRIIIE